MINHDINPLIKWEKWMDPFGIENEDAKWTDYNDNITDISSLKSKYSDEITDEENPEQQDQEIYKKSSSNPIKVIASPMGLIPYNEHTASSKIFNFWVGHTNFSITKSIVNVMEKIDGVEILDIFTRYRFRV